MKREHIVRHFRLFLSLLLLMLLGTMVTYAGGGDSVPTGKITILNTIANSAKKTSDVIWDASKVKGATNYEINWRARGASRWASRTVVDKNRGTTSGLTIGGCYEIRVRARGGAKGGPNSPGAWSNTVYRYFHTTQKIRLASKSRGSFTMSWARNPSATGYQVMFSKNKNGAGAAKNINTVGAKATSFTKTGLNPGSTYYVQVRELKRIGNTTYIGNISCPVAVKIKTSGVSIAAAAAATKSAGGGTVYWTPSGSVYHLSRDCKTLARSRTIHSGSISQSGKSRACKVCGY